ncbi:MAG TPA: S8 family serine peptidase [Gemmatimonadales bacterium]|nr:S8 family serine peptidase [Gemmatimonadales bacterium]
MRIGRSVSAAALVLAVAACERSPDGIAGSQFRPSLQSIANPRATIGINVLLTGPVTAAQLAELNTLGTVYDQIPELNALLMRAQAGQLPAIQALPYVAGANEDQPRGDAPVDVLTVSDFSNGLSTWDMDAVNVTVSPFTSTRSTSGFTGDGVYVGVIDTGLLDDWRLYFPEARIAAQYATSFQGGGALDEGNVSSQPNKWEHDQNSHGTHVTSTILGYNFRGVPINGVAPKATVIPIKVLNQNGSGWSSMVAKGITYLTDLKLGPLAGHPVVGNMSLGGPALDPLERAAIDRAVANGVILVAAAGNAGAAGMGYPGAYPPIISVAAVGWVGQWKAYGGRSFRSWWISGDVPDPSSASDVYIAPFSSREKAGQQLDVAAPGVWTVGPYQLTSSDKISYFFLSGTSMASPHVAGIVALMAEKHPALTAGDAETILKTSALPLPPGTATFTNTDGVTTSTVSWGANATGAGLVLADRALTATP